jgi:hypothetical protein
VLYVTDVIEIRDPELNQEEIRQRIQAQIAQRYAASGYSPDPATLGPESLRPGNAAERKLVEAAASFPDLNQALIELIARSYLREPRFISLAPIIGPLIVAVRRWWNWMSTKWYALPLIRQQSEINVRNASAISQMAHWQEITAQRQAELEARIAELEERLDALESREQVQ